MQLYYYKDPHGNFGDDLNAWLWREVAPEIDNKADGMRLSAVGTILGRSMPQARRWVVLGSGTGYSRPPAGFGGCEWDILCVRGPLTAHVLGLPPAKAGTDGAILLSLIPALWPLPASERQGTVFMPHHRAAAFGRWAEACKRAGIEYLDPREDSRYLAERLRRAKLVLAEAMHAAIVADTFRVPWVPLHISADTNSFKWLDWTLSMELPYAPVALPTSSLREAIYARLLPLFGLGNSFNDLTPEGAIRHYNKIAGREGFLSDKLRSVVFRLTRATPFGPHDERPVARATAALRAAANCRSFLSLDGIFMHKRRAMEDCLMQLRRMLRANVPAGRQRAG